MPLLRMPGLTPTKIAQGADQSSGGEARVPRPKGPRGAPRLPQSEAVRGALQNACPSRDKVQEPPRRTRRTRGTAGAARGASPAATTTFPIATTARVPFLGTVSGPSASLHGRALRHHPHSATHPSDVSTERGNRVGQAVNEVAVPVPTWEAIHRLTCFPKLVLRSSGRGGAKHTRQAAHEMEQRVKLFQTGQFSKLWAEATGRMQGRPVVAPEWADGVGGWRKMGLCRSP